MPGLNLLEVPFGIDIPRDIAFYSAHRKIEVYKWLVTNSNDYLILLDIDVVGINEMTTNLLACINEGIPTYYDITDQIYPSVGRSRILKDKISLNPMVDIGYWAGCGYIGGSGSFFGCLVGEID